MLKNRLILSWILAGLLPLTTSINLLIPFPHVFAQTTEDLRGRGDQLILQGLQQWQAGQAEATLRLWQQALQLYQQIQDEQRQSVVLENIGTLYAQIEQYHQAIEFFKPALRLVQKLRNREAEKIILFKLAEAYRDLEDYQNSPEIYQEALKLAQEFGDQNSQMMALGSLGLIYAKLRKYPEAINYQKQTVALAQQLQDPVNLAKALRYLGHSYYFSGDYQSALAYYEWSLKTAQESCDRELEALSWQARGNAAYYLQDYEKAVEYYQAGLKIAQQLKDEEFAGQFIGNIGLVYTHLERFSEAIEYLEQDLTTARKFGNKLVEGQALGNLGNIYYFQDNYNKALEYYQQGLALTRQTNYRRGEWIILTNIGATLLKLGQLSEAEKTLNQGMQILESLRQDLGEGDEQKISYTQQGERIYKLLQQTLIAENKIEAALEIAERSRARTLVEIMGNRVNSDLESSIVPPKIDEIKQIAKTQNATLVQYSIESEDNPLKQDKNQDLAIYIWVVKPTGEVIFKRSDISSLNTNLQNLVATTRDSIGVRGLPIVSVRPRFPNQPQTQVNLSQQFQQLYQILIEPIAEFLPTDPNSNVIFIPQDELFLVPFAALQDQQGKYLIEKQTILTVPAIQVLELTKKSQQHHQISQEILIVGNPVMPSIPPEFGEQPRQLPALPGAEQEAKAIAQLFQTQPWIGAEATKTAIISKMPSARIIHFATHGLFEDREVGYRGWGSSIALTPFGQDNGLLTAEEILNQLKLNADLVVLSACNTGRGKISGDGVIGLSRSFIASGVSSVIVSLWSVPDAPTARLMTEFYQNLQNNPNKAQALRQAMLTTMKQHPEPINWAAFTLMGEAESQIN